MNAGAKYEAVNKGSLLDRRETTSADLVTHPSPTAVPVISPGGRTSGARFWYALRLRRSKKTRTTKTIAPATPPTTPPAILPLVWLSRAPEPWEGGLVAEVVGPVVKGVCSVAVGPDPPSHPYEAPPPVPEGNEVVVSSDVVEVVEYVEVEDFVVVLEDEPELELDVDEVWLELEDEELVVVETIVLEDD